MKNIPVLTPRLKKIADIIKPCGCVADIGTDHAYLPAELCLREICRTAIALDINKGPLKKAEETVEKCGLKDRVELRLGDGAKPLSAGEADVITIAGMGGLLIGEIINASPEVFESAKQIIVQPMSSIPELRYRLYELGYAIENEVLVREEEKLYHIMSLRKDENVSEPDEFETLLGRELLRDKPEHFSEYISAKKNSLMQKFSGLNLAKEKNTEEIEKVSAMLKRIEEECK